MAKIYGWSRVPIAALIFLAFVALSNVPMWPQSGGAPVFDVDLTQGPGALPDPAKVAGGMWRTGWVVTGNNQHLILDAGYAVRNGVLEVTFANWDVSLNPVG